MPGFQVEKLLTEQEAQAALDYGNDEKRDLDHKLYNQQFSADDAADSAEERAKKLATANRKVTMHTTLIAGLDPVEDAAELRTQQTALRRATDRRDELADNRTLSAVEQLKRALEVAQAQAQLGETETFITQVSDRLDAIRAGN